MVERLPQNPLIKPADVQPSRPDFEVIGAFNAGVARVGEETVLLLRVAERPRERDANYAVAPIWNAERGEIDFFTVRRGDPDLVEEDVRVFRYRGDFYLTSISHLRLARSKDGVQFAIDEKPALAPLAKTEAFGLEDPRITLIGQDYWITYKAVSNHGITTALASTRDFVSYERHGIIFCPENLDVVIFPEKIGGQYAAWTRPVGKHLGSPSIWLARSPDLLHWGAHEPVLTPRPGLWDGARVGSSCVPFKTERGWVEIYHGADEANRYCCGVALIDLDDPSRVLARSDRPLMQPEAPYEVEGFFGGVVFACGADMRPDGQVFIYYGASDETTCAAATTVDELLTHVE
jgi:predicted GH43/DUF377 family glycosyl hydrolase